MTYLAIAPGNDALLKNLCSDSMAARSQLQAYRAKIEKTGIAMKKEIDLDNMEPGVRLHGVEVEHPLTGQKLPVFVAPYVVADYGPGALMGVPLHDERDCAFALANNLPLIQVLSDQQADEVSEETLVNSTAEFNGMKASEAAQAITEKLSEQGLGGVKTEYRLRDWLVSRQRYWGCPIPILFCESCGPVSEPNLPVVLPDISDDQASILKNGTPLEHLDSFVEGPTCPKCHQMPTRREVDTLDTFIDSSWYFLRYLDP